MQCSLKALKLALNSLFMHLAPQSVWTDKLSYPWSHARWCCWRKLDETGDQACYDDWMDSGAEDHWISFITTVESVCFHVSVFGLVSSESSVCVVWGEQEWMLIGLTLWCWAELELWCVCVCVFVHCCLLSFFLSAFLWLYKKSQ